MLRPLPTGAPLWLTTGQRVSVVVGDEVYRQTRVETVTDLGIELDTYDGPTFIPWTSVLAITRNDIE